MTVYSNRFPRGRRPIPRPNFHAPDRLFLPRFLKSSPVFTDYASGNCHNATNLTRLNRPHRTIGYHTYHVSNDPRQASPERGTP